MATYRYWDVRRDMYNHCANAPLKRNRTFNEMRKLFKWSFWALLISMIICMLSIFVLVFFFPSIASFSLIPIGIILVLSIVSEFLSDKMYNPAERQKELDERASCLKEYVQSINSVLVSHGIITNEQRAFLQKECEEQLEKHSKAYARISNRTFELLIGIPLGALVSALIYKSESTDILVSQLLFILIIGIAILSVAHVVKKISFYSEGHFKDRFLLQSLYELNYCSQTELSTAK